MYDYFDIGYVRKTQEPMDVTHEIYMGSFNFRLISEMI